MVSMNERDKSSAGRYNFLPSPARRPVPCRTQYRLKPKYIAAGQFSTVRNCNAVEYRSGAGQRSKQSAVAGWDESVGRPGGHPRMQLGYCRDCVTPISSCLKWQEVLCAAVQERGACARVDPMETPSGVLKLQLNIDLTNR